MMLPHNTLSLVLLIVLTATHHITGVNIGPVQLTSGLPYAKGQLPAQIAYSVLMQNGEKLESVLWRKDDGISGYDWYPNGSATVFGTLLGAIDTNAANGELLFPNVLPNYAGKYNLTVRTNLTNATVPYKLIVFDYSKSVFSQSSTPQPNCTWSVQMALYQVAPQPNISCVFEDGIGENRPSIALETVADVFNNITSQNSGTFNYEMASNISVKNIPEESSLSCIFRIEDINITLFKHKPSFAAQHCPEPFNMTDLDNTITNGYKSCYGGYNVHARVEYFCKNNPYLEPHKTLECGTEGNWTETDGTPWPSCLTETTTEPQTTTTQPNSTVPQTDPPSTEETDPPSTEQTDSGTPLTFHGILLAATFLIASYSAVK